MIGIEMGKNLFEKFKQMFPEIGKDALSWKLAGTKTIVVKMVDKRNVWFKYEDDSNYTLRMVREI